MLFFSTSLLFVYCSKQLSQDFILLRANSLWFFRSLQTFNSHKNPQSPDFQRLYIFLTCTWLIWKDSNSLREVNKWTSSHLLEISSLEVKNFLCPIFITSESDNCPSQKDVFPSCHKGGIKKVLSSPEEWNFRPFEITCSDALLLSLQDSSIN